MNNAQRYRIADAIARKLTAGYGETSGYDIYLQAFGIKTPFGWDDFGSSNHLYVLGTLQRNASEAQLSEIAEDLGITIGGLAPLIPPQMWKSPQGIRLFISHVSGEKIKASRLRECFRPFGIVGFVAHEDIEPTAYWQAEIEKALFTMDAFLSIHTLGFSSSPWTQQEVGFAVARRVPMVALKFDEDPKGFIGAKQALLRYDETAEVIAGKVADRLSRDATIAHRMAAYLMG